VLALVRWCVISLLVLPDTGWIRWFSALFFVQIPSYLTFLQDFSLIGYILSVVLGKVSRAKLCTCTKGAEHEGEPGSSGSSFPYQAFLLWRASHSPHIWVSLSCRFWSLELKCCANLAAQSQWFPVSACCQTSPCLLAKVQNRLIFFCIQDWLTLIFWRCCWIYGLLWESFYTFCVIERSHVTRSLG